MNHQIARKNTINEAIKRAIRKFSDKEAIAFDGRRWTYQQMDIAIDHIASYLLEQGFKSGDHIAAYGANSDAYVLLWLSCVRLGIVHVPVNFALTANELKYILKQSESVAVFYDKDLSNTVASLKDELPNMRLYGTIHGGETAHDILNIALNKAALETPLENSALYQQAVDFNAQSAAQILYTSGTTSLPKGALLSHEAFLAEYMSAIYALEFNSEDRHLAALPLYHSAQMHVFLMPALLTGAENIIIKSPKPEICFKLFVDEKINTFFAAPTVWISLLRHSEFTPEHYTSLRKGYYGASIMPLPVLQELRKLLPALRFFNCYGQSECAPLVSCLSPEDHEIAPASAGRPVLNVETRIVDINMQDVPLGEMGEIVHRTPHLMTEYWNNPEETDAAFEGGWFHSGDLGYMDEHGFIYIVDRIKDTINSGGVLVASREVEECLYKHPAVAEVAVIGLDDEKWVEVVCAVVTLKEGSQVSAEELIAYARQHLAPFKVPKAVHFKDDLPRNASGKLLKRELRKEFKGLENA